MSLLTVTAHLDEREDAISGVTCSLIHSYSMSRQELILDDHSDADVLLIMTFQSAVDISR